MILTMAQDYAREMKDVYYKRNLKKMNKKG